MRFDDRVQPTHLGSRLTTKDGEPSSKKTNQKFLETSRLGVRSSPLLMQILYPEIDCKSTKRCVIIQSRVVWQTETYHLLFPFILHTPCAAPLRFNSKVPSVKSLPFLVCRPRLSCYYGLWGQPFSDVVSISRLDFRKVSAFISLG
ncbi:hypothetical protein V6N13_082904 [Hibiscus sabdariffa]|uniref:Uncharacterized protein n=1 Tax=Hibiscus sabdariffa TaxID=183260 RepID=A0ABR2BZL1_9ROSI